jgi:dolichol-phosphate mannosyltransferase
MTSVPTTAGAHHNYHFTFRARLSRWWCETLFPGNDTGQATPAVQVLHLTLLVLLAAALFFTRLSCPLLEPEETRYAEIPRQMLAEGRLVEPVWHGQPYYHKPPLLYWLVMASYGLFGVHDWAARLVPACCGVGTVLLTWWWGKRVAGAWPGFLGAVILCLSARYVYLGRMLTTDSLLCLWVVAALATAHVALRGESLRRGLWLLSGAACGLGLLTKGPVALVLVMVPIVLWRMLDRRGGRPSLRDYLAYVAVAVAVASPWYLAVTLTHPAAAVEFFWLHNVLRFVDPLDHAKPFWFHLPGLLVGTLPWSLLLLPLARRLAGRPAAPGVPLPAATGFFLLAFVCSLAFFSCSRCKRPAYIVPALPPFALLLGSCLATAPLPKLGYWATALALALGAIVAGLAGALGVWDPGAGVVAAPALAVLGLVWCWCGRGRPAPLAWGVCAGTLLVLLLAGVHQVLPGYNRKFSPRGQVRRHLEQAADPRVPVICYPKRWDAVSFYLRRDDVRVYGPAERARMIADLDARPHSLVVVKADRSLRDFVAALPESLEFVPDARKGMIVAVGVVRHRPVSFGKTKPAGESSSLRGGGIPPRRLEDSPAGLAGTCLIN